MFSSAIEKALNQQVEREAMSSQYYLAMATWAELHGYAGTAEFLYHHSDEERIHMLRLLRFINERGGRAVVSSLKEPKADYEDITAMFEEIYDHECAVSADINKLIEICQGEKDFTTQHFLQWYVSEQIEEEALARKILDKLRLIEGDRGGLYLFDRELEALAKETAALEKQRNQSKT
jgi:ferritin